MGYPKLDVLRSSIADDYDPTHDTALHSGASSERGGYKNPPEDKQFQKGQKRPKGAGRQKGSLNKSTVRKALYKFFFETTVVVKAKDGTSRSVPRFEALLATGFERAVKGSCRDLKTLLDVMLRLVDDAEDPDDQIARMVQDLSLY